MRSIEPSDIKALQDLEFSKYFPTSPTWKIDKNDTASILFKLPQGMDLTIFADLESKLNNSGLKCEFVEPYHRMRSYKDLNIIYLEVSKIDLEKFNLSQAQLAEAVKQKGEQIKKLIKSTLSMV